MELVVGRIGRPHGIKGEVSVEVRTDEPELRFAAGSVLVTDPADRGPLTVQRSHWHSGRLLVTFDGVVGREGAEALRNTVLVVDSDDLPGLDDPDEYYDHQLIGLAAELASGGPVGVVEDVIHSPAGDLLSIRKPDGGEALVPFLAAMVPSVDLAARRVLLDPPEGLLEL